MAPGRPLNCGWAMMGLRNPNHQLKTVDFTSGFQASFWWCRISATTDTSNFIRFIIIMEIQQGVYNYSGIGYSLIIFFSSVSSHIYIYIIGDVTHN